jgi:hypothetical protein
MSAVSWREQCRPHSITRGQGVSARIVTFAAKRSSSAAETLSRIIGDLQGTRSTLSGACLMDEGSSPSCGNKRGRLSIRVAIKSLRGSWPIGDELSEL